MNVTCFRNAAPVRFLSRIVFALILWVLPLSPGQQLYAQSEPGSKKDEQARFEETLTRAGFFLTKNQQDSFHRCADEARRLANQLKNPEAHAKTDLLLGDYFQWHRQQFDTARTFYLAGLQRLRRGTDPALRLRFFAQLAQNYYDSFLHAQVADYCTACIQLADSLGDKRTQIHCLSLMAAVVGDIKHNPIGSEPHLRQAHQLALELGDTTVLARSYFRLGRHFQGINDPDSAFAYLATSEALHHTTRDSHGINEARFFRGLTFYRIGQYGKTIEILKNLLPAYAAERDTLRLIHVHKDIASAYFQLGQNSAVIENAQLGFAFIKNRPMPFEKRELYTLLYQAHKRLGDWKTALLFAEKLSEIKDTIFDQNQLSAVAYTAASIKQIDAQRQIEQQHQRKTLYQIGLLLAGVVIGLLIWAFRNVQKTRRELQRQKNLVDSQHAELQQLDELKSRFFANVSHELRTPLTLLLGPIGSVLNSAQLDDRSFALLKKAQRGGKDLQQLVNEILDLSKMESGSMELREKPVLLPRLLRRWFAQFESYAHSQGLELVFEYRASEDLQVLLDAEKLEKVLNNFLTNAIKFTPKGGRVAVHLEERGDKLLLSVADTGRGIHPDDLPNVFDRFYQTTRPEAPAEGGTGIGLALVHEYAHLFGGKTWVDSEPGKGSTFFFEFPKKLAAAGDGEPLAAEETPEEMALTPVLPATDQEATSTATRPTVLVVEDNPDLRDYLRLILEEKYKVVTAENGKVALDWLTANGQQPTADLIISDLMMPVMDGFQFLEKVKSDDHWRHLPFIMLTAKVDDKAKLRALRVGVDDYLTKPFGEEELKARIENLLHNYRQRMEMFSQNEDATEGSAVENRPVITRADAEWLEEVEGKLNKYLPEADLKMERVAAELFLSHRQFSRKLKSLTGLTPSQYLKEIRLNCGKELLLNKQYKTIKEVATAVGFTDARHFSDLFQAHFGAPPSGFLR
ncbi:MAG: ATP-binding protein [Saprospiraceae bacterium]